MLVSPPPHLKNRRTKSMEAINYSDILFLKAERMLRPLGEVSHHVAYTRVHRGKMETIPQKGTIIKERGEIRPQAKEVLGREYTSFIKDVEKYVEFSGEIDRVKNEVKELAKGQEEVMSRIRPYLTKFENLAKEEGKFTTEFMGKGYKYRFLSYPRETTPYKELYEESFKRLASKMQAEMVALKEQLKKVTVQEKFERVEKAILDETKKAWDKIVEHMRNIVRLKEEMVKNMKKMDASIKKSLELPKVIVLEKATKEDGRTRSRKRTRRNHDISGRRATAEPLEDALVVTLDDKMLGKARVKPYR